MSAIDSLTSIEIPIPAIAAFIAAIGALVAIRTFRGRKFRDTRDDLVKAQALASSVEDALADKARKAQRGELGSGLTTQEIDKFTKILNEALVISPESPHVQIVSASFYSAIGNLAKAESAYRKAIDLEDKNPHNYLALFIHLVRTHKDEADQHLRKALVYAKTNPEVFADIGMALNVIGREDEAESAYRSGLAIDPHISKLWYNLGRLLTKRGQYKEAHDALEKAASVNPNDPEIFCNYGNACLRIGNTKKAIEMLENAIRLDPKYALAYRNLAAAYHAAGHDERAKWALQKSQELAAS